MNTVIDSLYLRRIRVDYTSPAICEVLVSLTGSSLTVEIEGDI